MMSQHATSMAGHRVFVNLTAVCVHVAVHPLDDAFGLERVLPFPLRPEFVDSRFHGPGHEIDRALADAVYPLVSVHACKQPVFPRVAGDKSLDVRNLHEMPRFWNWETKVLETDSQYCSGARARQVEFPCLKRIGIPWRPVTFLFTMRQRSRKFVWKVARYGQMQRRVDDWMKN